MLEIFLKHLQIVLECVYSLSSVIVYMSSPIKRYFNSNDKKHSYMYVVEFVIYHHPFTHCRTKV